MKNKFISTVLAFAMALALCASLLVPSIAASPGSVTVTAKFELDTGSVVLAGDTYSLKKLAASELPSDWNTMKASEKQEMADKLQKKHVKADDFDASGKTGSDGSLSFTGLSTGTYLVARTGVATANKNFTCFPMVVPLPMQDPETGASTMNVTLTPKFEYTGTPLPQDPDKPTVPDPTGTTKPSPDTPTNPADPDAPTTQPADPDNPTTTKPGQTTTKPGQTTTRTTTKPGTTTTRTSVITRITKAVNTDSARALTIALVILGVSAAALIIVIVAKRRNEDEDE